MTAICIFARVIRSVFFENGTFIEPYPWQTEAELTFYRERASWLIESYGSVFSRVKPFVPIAPNMVDAAASAKTRCACAISAERS